MAIESQGILLFWSGTTAPSTAAANTIGQVISFNGPSGSANKIDITHLASTAKEYLMGLRDEGDITMDVLYQSTDAGQLLMWNDRAARNRKKWVIKINPTAASTVHLKGDGFCTGFAITGGVDDAIKASITIAISGAVILSSTLATT